MMRESPMMVAHDVGWEGLVTPITFIGLWERATGFITDIVIHKLE